MNSHDEMTTRDETTTTTETEARPPLAESVEKIVHGIFGVGRLWAAHGLNIGRSALETSATTLRTTAELLGEISERFEPQTTDGAPGERKPA